MRTDMGLFDRLFGKKVTVELPEPDGSVREVEVTKRWFEEMKRIGKIRPAGGQLVKVHILDAQAGLGHALGLSEEQMGEFEMSEAPEPYRVEEWTIGEEVSAEQCEEFRDPETLDLYVLIVYDAGKPVTHTVRKENWIEARSQMGV